MARTPPPAVSWAPFYPVVHRTLAKFLLLIALAILAYLLFKGLLRRDARRQGSVRPSEPRGEAAPEDMVRCALCGVHLPRSESFTSRGKFFCSDEHRRLGVH